MRQIKCLIFDYNSNIVDDHPAHLDAYMQAFDEYGIKISRKTLEEQRGLSSMEKVRFAIRTSGSNANPKQVLSRKEDIYIATSKGKDLLFPEAKAALRRLKGKFVMAIYTGSARRQFYEVLDPEVKEMFRLIITGEEAVKPKPYPDTLLMIAKRLGYKSEECAYVGDAPTDMQAAKNAGMLALGVTHHYATPKELKDAGADHVFYDLKELADWLLK